MRLSDFGGGGRPLEESVSGYERLRYFEGEKIRVGFATPNASYYVLHIMFRSTGQIWVQCPAFKRKDGVLWSGRSEQAADGSRQITVSPSGAYKTSHLVKLNHPVDGRAHFSQDGRIITRVRRAAAFRLHGPMGKFCRLHTFLPAQGFEEFSKDEQRKRGPILIAQARQLPEAVSFHLEWRRKVDVSAWASPGGHVGPRDRVRNTVSGKPIMVRFLGAPAGFAALKHHVLMLFTQATRLPSGITAPSMLLEAGFDSDEVPAPGEPAPRSEGQLTWWYPRPESLAGLRSIDLDRGPGVHGYGEVTHDAVHGGEEL